MKLTEYCFPKNYITIIQVIQILTNILISFESPISIVRVDSSIPVKTGLRFNEILKPIAV